MKRITLFMLLFLLVQTAHSGVYKCILEGKTTYSQQPCEGQITEVQIEKSKPSTDRSRSAEDYRKANKEVDASINTLRAQRRIRQLNQDLSILRNRMGREIEKYRSMMRRAATKADVMILQQQIANRRSEYLEAIRRKEAEISSTASSIGPGGGR